MAFGMCVNATPSALPVGALSALADELGTRGLLPDVMGVLPQDQARALMVRITVDRQRARRARRSA